MTKQIWSRKGDKAQQPYHYMGSILDNVYLMGGYEIVKDDDGDGVIIHDLDGLHTAIAMHLVQEQKVFSGKEIRYLRTYMDLSQSALSKLLGCDSQMIARYEKEQSDIPAPTDRLLRMIVLGHVMGKVDVHGVVQQIEEMEGELPHSFRFKQTPKGWKAA
ncbi:MAG: hypothetical protein WCD70_01945 [Alphaproteobacteria bacterium]